MGEFSLFLHSLSLKDLENSNIESASGTLVLKSGIKEEEEEEEVRLIAEIWKKFSFSVKTRVDIFERFSVQKFDCLIGFQVSGIVVSFLSGSWVFVFLFLFFHLICELKKLVFIFTLVLGLIIVFMG